jgi:O-antigen ligase
MSAAAQTAPRSIYSLNVKSSTFDWSVIIQLCACVIPAMASIDIAQPRLGGMYLAGSLICCLGYHLVKRDRFKFMSLLIGAGPALSLLRGVFFYDSLFFFLVLGFILWAYMASNEVLFVWHDPIWKALVLFCGLYWFLSVALKGNLGANLRALEFAATAGAVYLLSFRRAYLGTAFLGIAVSASAYAVAMLPYGNRLGEGELDNGETIGNPALMGLPSALIVLLCLTDRGRYFLMESKAAGRLIVCLTISQWLILSGSRGSWLITISCLLIVFAFSANSRKTILVVLSLGCLATMLLLATDRGSMAATVFSKTVDGNRSLANRTSGRSAMWEVLPQVFAASPIWGWGPGSGADVDYIYTHRHLIFHSLYEQIIAECGMLGFIPLMIILGYLLKRGISHYRKIGELTPLVGIVGFMLIGMSVTAFDFVSGVFFGIALMAREPNPRFVAHRMLITPMEVEQEEEIADESVITI